MSVSIRCPALGRTLQVEAGANLFSAIRAADIPLGSSCGGDGVCQKCVLTVRVGEGALRAVGDVDPWHLDEDGERPGELRVLSCQVAVVGDVEVVADYW
jgi:2Fe-2S ferredoxin